MGMVVRQRSQDVIADNLANASTPGFRREIAQVFAQKRQMPVAGAPEGREFSTLGVGSVTDYRAGAMRQTGSFRDVALEGNAFLAVRTPGGDRLSRGGALHANAAGELVNASGHAFLGENDAPIKVGNGPWEIRADGTVTAGGAVAGKLRLTQPMGGMNALQHEGNGLFSAPGGMRPAAANNTEVRQGFIEMSNVEPVREMVDMIAGVRAYESAQRAVTAADESVQQLLTVLQR